MAEFAAIPLFTDSWIADTGHLTRAERGLYMDLLILIWRSPECRVPNDLAWIARRLRVEADELPTLQSVVAEFLQSTGNWLTQKRLKREWNYTLEKRQKNIDSAKARWKKGKGSSERNANAMPDMQCERNAPSPSPSPSPSVKEREANASPKKVGSRILPDWQMPSEWLSWAVSEGMSLQAAETQAARFKDYWQAKPGKDGVKLDWQATWRNWVRKAREDFKPKLSATPQPGEIRTFPNGQTKIYDSFNGWVPLV